MIAVDTNILVYAHRGESPFHAAALECMIDLAEGAALWAIPWPCVYEFIGVVTNPRIYDPRTPLATALAQVDAWFESPAVRLMSESEGHWPALRSVLASANVAGAKVHDARIAALCNQHGVRELWSADRDFGRFRGLAVVNPLVAAPPP